MAEFESTKHYVNDPAGAAEVRFYPGNHGYFVTDPGHPDGPKKNARTGGGTSLTGLMAKGQGLMLYPMYEMKKHLKSFFEVTTLQELIDDPETTIEAILAAGTMAHTKKSDLGKNVGTSAHEWVELWSNTLMEAQKSGKKFVAPEIPEVQDISKVLRTGYIRVINALKPKELDDFKKLPRLFLKEIEMQEAIWNEATMVRQSIVAAKQWLDMHEIKTFGAEGTVYSREFFICGKYDDDWEVTCTKKCDWCYRNGNSQLPEEDFTGRYIVDFKSTNASKDAPKGIYPEYLAQCAIYEMAILEEFPDRKYDGSLILNGSKKPYIEKKKDRKTGEEIVTEYPVFNTHFSFNSDQHRAWARNLAALKDQLYVANKEMKESNAGIKIPGKAAGK